MSPTLALRNWPSSIHYVAALSQDDSHWLVADLLNQSTVSVQYTLFIKFMYDFPFPVLWYIFYRKIAFVSIVLVACYTDTV